MVGPSSSFWIGSHIGRETFPPARHCPAIGRASGHPFLCRRAIVLAGEPISSVHPHRPATAPSSSPPARVPLLPCCSSCTAASTSPRPCCCRRWNHQGHRKPSRLPYFSSRDRDRPCGQVRRSATRPLFPCLALGASSPSSEFAAALLLPHPSIRNAMAAAPWSPTGLDPAGNQMSPMPASCR